MYAIVCWEEGREACQSSIAGLKTVKYGGYLRCARAGNGRHHPVFSAARPEPACLGPVVQPWRAEGESDVAGLDVLAWPPRGQVMKGPFCEIKLGNLSTYGRRQHCLKQRRWQPWSMVFAQNRFATRKSAKKVWNLRVVKIDKMMPFAIFDSLRQACCPTSFYLSYALNSLLYALYFQRVHTTMKCSHF